MSSNAGEQLDQMSKQMGTFGAHCFFLLDWGYYRINLSALRIDFFLLYS